MEISNGGGSGSALTVVGGATTVLNVREIDFVGATVTDLGGGTVRVTVTSSGVVWGGITGTLSNQTDLQTALNALVPYTGATANVNIGTHSFTDSGDLDAIVPDSRVLVDNGGIYAMDWNNRFLLDATGTLVARWNSGFQVSKTELGSVGATLDPSLTTANRTFTFPNASGTFALTSGLTGFVTTDQTVGQTIGATGARLTKLWATDITVTNAITGSVTGNAGTATALATGRTIGGVTFDGTANIVPQTIQSVNEATDTTCFPLFISASGSQSLQPLNNAGLTYNSNTNALTATTFIGALTGNASTVTTNANLTGPITSSGNATAIASQTGTGTKFVVDTSPTLVTPNIGVATATSLSISNAGAGFSFFNLTNGQIVSIQVTAQTVGTAALTLPDFAGQAQTFVFDNIAQTLNSKKIVPRVVTAADATSITPTTANADMTYQANTQAVGTLTINDDATANPGNGTKWILKIKSTNIQTYSWNARYISGSGTGAVTLPTTSTGGSKVDNIGFIYDGVSGKWMCVAYAPGY